MEYSQLLMRSLQVNVTAQSGCVGTIILITGKTLTRRTMMMDVNCNGNETIGTTSHALKRAVTDSVGLINYTAWYEGIIDGKVYRMLRMDANGEANLDAFFSGVIIGRDPNLFRIVTPANITGLIFIVVGDDVFMKM